VGYLADCQHRRLPQYFTAGELRRRDAVFGRMLERATVVVVNSRAARDDFSHFYPGHRAQILALPFSAHATDAWLSADAAETRRRLGLPARYFIVCNQFWLHKDHPTAFRALARALERGLPRDVHFLCTGKLEDERDPAYPERIRHLIGELGLADRTRLLGYLPKADQATLVKGAAAVIQPTLFEGGPGGGAAYDAISLGAPLLATGIPVNRELPPGRVRFFPPGDAEKLAELMVEVVMAPPPKVPIATLRTEGAERLRAFGRALLSAADMALGRGDARPG
jgi:glycosyltransferase involved in cell wall biosynthesis